MDTNLYFNNDMASAANAVREFDGQDDDINIWIRETEMMCRALALSEEREKQIIITKIRGSAHSWLSELQESCAWNISTLEIA